MPPRGYRVGVAPYVLHRVHREPSRGGRLRCSCFDGGFLVGLGI
jgi:hypothetical protein